MADKKDDSGCQETDADRARKTAQVEESLAIAAEARARAEHLTAERHKIELEAKQAELSLISAERRERDELSKDRYHHLYVFDQAVGDSSVRNCISELTLWDRQDPGCPIEIVFNSPGGSVVSGLALFDFIGALRSKGHYVTTSTIGYAASMAGILLQAGDTRIMGAESWLLLHEASFLAAGKIGEVEDMVGWVKKISKRVLHIFSSRANVSERWIDNHWKRKDFWVSSDDALKWGFIDQIR